MILSAYRTAQDRAGPLSCAVPGLKRNIDYGVLASSSVGRVGDAVAVDDHPAAGVGGAAAERAGEVGACRPERFRVACASWKRVLIQGLRAAAVSLLRVGS